jgi:hypothetical protein
MLEGPTEYIRGMSHDRQAAGTGGRHWPRGLLPYHTSGIFTGGKSTWYWKNSDLYYRGKEVGSPAKVDNQMPGPILSLFSLHCAKLPFPPRPRQPEVVDIVQLNMATGSAAHLVRKHARLRRGPGYNSLNCTLAWTDVWHAARLARP